MKVLKGSLKGRNIICPEHIRPVSTMVRKACFDILKEEILDKKVLDLFGGSGALGIEALSCGAEQAVFVDIKKSCIETIRKNLAIFKLAAKASLHLKDAFWAVRDFFSNKETFDFIFLDPPYYKGILRKILQTLEVYDILSPFGYIVGFCYIKDDCIRKSRNFSLISEKKYGQTLLLIYRKEEVL